MFAAFAALAIGSRARPGGPSIGCEAKQRSHAKAGNRFKAGIGIASDAAVAAHSTFDASSNVGVSAIGGR